MYERSLNSLDVDMFAAILATNYSEAYEYLITYVKAEILFYILCGVSLLLLIFYKLSSLKFKLNIISQLILFLLVILSVSVIVTNPKKVGRVNVVRLFHQGMTPDLKEYRQNPLVVKNNNSPRNIVMIIGESFSKSHSSLYGYGKRTNPMLATMFSDSVLYVFKNITSVHTGTTPNIKAIMSSYKDEYSDSIQWYKCLNIIDVMGCSGYKTRWISNQSKRGLADNEVGRYAELCDVESFVGDKYSGMNRRDLDEELLPFIEEHLKDSLNKNFFVIQMMGSHSAFKMRYPKSFERFVAVDYDATHNRLSTENKQLLAEYDNSVLYNDSVVYEIMQRFADEEAVVFYFPDHALDVFESSDDYIAHAKPGDELSEYYGKQIPFMVYTTENFRNKFPQIEQRIKAAVDVPYRTDSVMYTIMDVAGVETVDGVSYSHKSLFK